ncbi:MAG: serine/threonine protein kinase [Acidobacteria bacterium]|nr:serine/threonine protein kinase [Acidobacteriota bacterium]
MPELDLTPDSEGPPASRGAPPPPAHLDHYDVLGRLGEGGMGEVYLARDRRLGRQVALKMLAGRFHSEAHLRERFVSEARAVSALEHPHVCRLYDVGEWKGRPYFTMERLRGETLRERLRRGPLAAVEVRRIGAEVAGALAAAHDVGILHCDIKPSNLFLTEDAGAKVMDFGIARRLQTNFGSGGGAAGAASTASPAPAGLPRQRKWPGRCAMASLRKLSAEQRQRARSDGRWPWALRRRRPQRLSATGLFSAAPARSCRRPHSRRW